MKEIVELLPQIILPLILGGSFVYVFKIASLRTYKIAWIPCYIFGYILQYVALLIYDVLNLQLQTRFISLLAWGVVCLAGCIIAYLLGKFSRSVKFKKILIFLKIHDSLEERFWTDLNDVEKGTRLLAYFDNGNKIIEGRISVTESNTRYPQIALSDYTIYKNYKANGEPEEYEEFVKRIDEDNARLIIDTQKCDLIELTYGDKSRVLVERKINKG